MARHHDVDAWRHDDADAWRHDDADAWRHDAAAWLRGVLADQRRTLESREPTGSPDSMRSAPDRRYAQIIRPSTISKRFDFSRTRSFSKAQGESMSHVLHHDGHYFRIETAEVANADDPDKPVFVSWCSDAFRELKDMPSQALSRFVAGEPLAKRAEAIRHAHAWIKTNWDQQNAQRALKVNGTRGLVYTVWLFKGGTSVECAFEEFAAARTFAKAAENILDIKKVAITDNESPQYLTLWEKAT